MVALDIAANLLLEHAYSYVKRSLGNDKGPP